MYEIVSASNTAFLARATGDIDGDGTNDVWSIDEVGDLAHTTID
jgi:hypothetical protein